MATIINRNKIIPRKLFIIHSQKQPATRRVLHRPLFNNLLMSFVDNGGLSDRIKGLIPHLSVKPPRGHCYL